MNIHDNAHKNCVKLHCVEVNETITHGRHNTSMQYPELYVFSLPISLVMIVRMCALLSYFPHQIGSMKHL